MGLATILGLDSRRRVARLALIVTLALFASTVLLSGGPLTSTVNAQGTTASPSPSSEFTINFLNPSGTSGPSEDPPPTVTGTGPGNEISGKAEDPGGDGTYHIVAWVNKLPVSSPLVEFKIEQGDVETTLTGPGGAPNATGAPDTYHFYWNVGGTTGLEDGPATLTASFFSGSTELARATASVTINNSDPGPTSPSPEDQGETVEIVYPQQSITGSSTPAWGVYVPPSGTGVGVIDVLASPGTTGATGTGLQGVRGFYTVSTPGSQPQWKSCGPQETRANSVGPDDGVRCSIPPEDDPLKVSAVSVLAVGNFNDNVGPSSGSDPDSGDAHRALTYKQVPATVTVDSAGDLKSAEDEGPFACSPVLRAIVRDSFGRKIAGVNLDVHAQGPNDQVHFGSGASTFKAPDKGNHGPTEPSVTCSGSPPPTNAGTPQGEHELPGSNNIKHVESTTGTEDSGRFRFRLGNRGTSSSATGTTFITAWADTDDDDRRCSAEASGRESFGWGTDPQPPTDAPPEVTSCPSPSPSPTVSGSSSPTTTPSQTSTATATQTPTATSSSTPPTTPPPSTTTDTPPSDRELFLDSSDREVIAGGQVFLDGSLLSGDSGCESDEAITIRRRVLGSSGFETLRETRTGQGGKFAIEIRPTESAEYRAIAPATSECSEATSNGLTVEVKAKVTSNVSDLTPERGDTVKITGKVKPNEKGTKVKLQRKKRKRWVAVATDKLNAASRYNFKIVADFGKAKFRVRFPGDADNEANNSKPFTINPQ